MIPNWKNRTMWTGDNLPIMRTMNSESVDLIYLDPPFNSKQDYAAPIGSKAAGAEFKDTWSLSDLEIEWLDLIENKHHKLHRVIEATMTDSDKAYLIYMAVRLLEMKRILKETGSIYLHCDPTMSHWLKLMTDSIFGNKNFKNEIVWHYRGGGVSKKRFGRRHDIILFYSKGKVWNFNADSIRTPYSKESLERLRYTAKSFRGNKVYNNYKPHPKGKHPDDVFDIQPIMPSSKKRLGYPTQKPLTLLQLIIKASSNIEDVVFDPFCGCATTLVAAEALQ